MSCMFMQQNVWKRQSEGTLEDVLECFDDSQHTDGMYLQEPEERLLGRHYEEVNGKLEIIDVGYKIPLLQSLQCLLRTDVREQVHVS